MPWVAWWCAGWVCSGERQHRYGLGYFLEEKQNNRLQGWQKERDFSQHSKRGFVKFVATQKGLGSCWNESKDERKGSAWKVVQARERSALYLHRISHQTCMVVCFALLYFQKFSVASLVLNETYPWVWKALLVYSHQGKNKGIDMSQSWLTTDPVPIQPRKATVSWPLQIIIFLLSFTSY